MVEIFNGLCLFSSIVRDTWHRFVGTVCDLGIPRLFGLQVSELPELQSGFCLCGSYGNVSSNYVKGEGRVLNYNLSLPINDDGSKVQRNKNNENGKGEVDDTDSKNDDNENHCNNVLSNYNLSLPNSFPEYIM